MRAGKSGGCAASELGDLGADAGQEACTAAPASTLAISGEAARQLAEGQVGNAEPYALRLQALYMLHRGPFAPWQDLEVFIGACLRYFGGAVHEHFEGGKVVSLSPGLMARLRQRSGTVRGTFDPREAGDSQALLHFARGHPLIDQLLSLPVETDPAVTAIWVSTDPPSGVRIEIYYEVQVPGLRPVGRLLRHLVDCALKVGSSRVSAMPRIGQPARGQQVPAWTAAAIDASERQLRFDVAEILARFEAARETWRELQGRLAQVAARIEAHEAWISEKQVTGLEGDRRILPARRGLLRRDRERIARLRAECELLESEYMMDLEDSTQSELNAAVTVLAAGVVIGA